MTIHKMMPGGRCAGKNIWRETITEFELKEVSMKQREYLEKLKGDNSKREDEYRRNFFGDFNMRPERPVISVDLARPEKDETIMRVQSRFGMQIFGNKTKVKTRFMIHRKKRIDKKWAKNPEYWKTIGYTQDFPVIQTVAV